MTRRRIGAFVDALLGNRRPPAFPADPEDAEAMRGAIEMRSGAPGAGLPRPEFVAELHRELSESSSRSPSPGDRARRVSRRGVLAGTAAAAVAAVAGAAAEERLSRPSAPTRTPSTLVPDGGAWQAVGHSSELAGGQVVRFATDAAVGFVSRGSAGLRGVSGACSHQGCLLALDQAGGKLDCPCHRASFSLTGQVLRHELMSAPPTLPAFEVRERDGQIEVLLPPAGPVPSS